MGALSTRQHVQATSKAPGTRDRGGLWPESRWGRAALVALCGYMLLYLSWQLLHWTPGRLQYGQAFLPVMDAAALAACLTAAAGCRAAPRLRSFWRAMSLAVAAQTIADVLLLVNVVRHRTPPFPSPADPFFLAFYVLLFRALLLVPVAQISRARRLGILLDGATIVVGGGAVVWYVVLGPTLQSGSTGPLATAVSVAYPVGDLILLAGLAFVLLRAAPATMRVPLLLIAAGMLASFVGDMVYGYGVLHGTYTNGDPIDTLYVLELFLFALAARAQRRPQREASIPASEQSTPAGGLANLVPYLGFATGFAVLLVVASAGSFFPQISVAIVVFALAGLVAARQHVSQRDLSRALGALDQSRRRFETIFENAGVGIVFAQVDGPAIVAVNATFTRMTGYSSDDLRGRDFRSIADPVDRRRLDRLASAGMDGFQDEIRVICADGSRIWGNLTLSLLRDEQQAPRHVIGVLEDVTKRKQAERAKDELLAVVGHELRTPLTSIRGSLGLLEGEVLGPLSEEAKQMAALAVQSSDRLARLIDDILDLERIDAERIAIEPAPVQAADLVREAVDALRASAEQAAVKIEVDARELTVLADADRIVQVLVNLLGNAIKFSAAAATVTVGVSADRGQALFSVADAGRGIPADQLDAIFERFHQVDSSDARQKGGTGLGLPIARGIVERHQGRIWAQSERGHGSVFYFTLPLAKQPQLARL